VHAALVAGRLAGSWARSVFEADGAAPLPDSLPAVLQLPLHTTPGQATPHSSGQAPPGHRTAGGSWRGGALPLEVQLARALAEAYGARTEAKTAKESAAAQRQLRQHLGALLRTGARADLLVRCGPALAAPAEGTSPEVLAEKGGVGGVEPADLAVVPGVRCHKFILAHRSAFFRAAIAHAPPAPRSILPASLLTAAGGAAAAAAGAAAPLPVVELPAECSAAPSLGLALLGCLYGGRAADEVALVVEMEVRARLPFRPHPSPYSSNSNAKYTTDQYNLSTTTLNTWDAVKILLPLLCTITYAP
jgi:hypothetical protein